MDQILLAYMYTQKHLTMNHKHNFNILTRVGLTVATLGKMET